MKLRFFYFLFLFWIGLVFLSKSPSPLGSLAIKNLPTRIPNPCMVEMQANVMGIEQSLKGPSFGTLSLRLTEV